MTQTISDFLTAHGITMTAKRVDQNPNMGDATMDHWQCVFRKGRQSFKTFYSMGSAHRGKEPKAAEVLNCLASDAASVVNTGGFEEWARDLGFDPDSRKAEKIFNTIEKQATKLAKFLGDDAYQDLICEVERL